MSIWESNTNWIELGRKPEISVNSLGLSTLLKDTLISGKGHISECYVAGSVAPKSVDAIKEKVSAMGGRLLYKLVGATESTLVWVWDDGMVEFAATSAYITVSVISKNEKFVREIREYTTSLILPAQKKGHVFAICKQGPHLTLSTLGNAGIKLMRDNYMPDVIKDYDYVIKDLNSAQPSGRIVVMEGEPGTGKTHLVRAMLLDVPDSMFVLVSPEMVSSLGGPELLPLLLNNRYHTTGPIILVLEDADKCLVTRGGDNINSIQSLLNLGDGILGSMLDLRIIATTNAKKLEMEAAIMRPGRLSKAIRVGPLNSKVAISVFQKLVPEFAGFPAAEMFAIFDEKKMHTLAEVYFAARNHGWNPESRKLTEDPAKKPAVFDSKDEEDEEY